ncbi:MAG: hypothetical protein LQ343_004259 [Gyalolechia ehrenbergii]|nr:MAG: hypothetical protein LQ343_004259 [Gyalolechia ehrenbergii]
MTSITEVQERKEQNIERKFKDIHENEVTNQTQSDAARTLQRTYRGHRARRELKGLSLSPSARWTEAVKEAKYRDLTTPRPSSKQQTSESSNGAQCTLTSSDAQQQWRRIGKIARRAGGDEYSSYDNNTLSPSEQDEQRQKRQAHKEERMRTSRTMDLPYFLEMVDLHHRYGSHLRKFHAEWERRPTHENFFYWLDYGEGKDVSLQNCSREKLDSMKVRYLGREERVNYAVEVDQEGKLCWKRNGVRVNTNEEWRDSIKGIVRVDDEAPSPSPGLGFYVSSSESSGLSSGDHSGSESSGKEKKPQSAVAAVVKHTVKDFVHDEKTKMLDHRRFKHPPKEPGGKKKKKKNMWIFVCLHIVMPVFTCWSSDMEQVADTSYNLYIGIKQSGAFQHSSFLHGARVSAAGLIKVKDGQLQYMQPRSGHYKPPASSFRAFVHSLQKRGVDMSVMSVPKSYAVLIGLEGYSKGMENMQKIKKAVGLEKGGGDGSGNEEKEGERRKQKHEKGKERDDEGGGIGTRSDANGSGME